MIICDTDVLIELFDNKRTRHNFTKELINEVGIENVLLTAISRMELIKGAIHKNDSIQIAKKIKKFDTILINPEITLRSIDLINNYHLSHGLNIPDALIAATSIEVGLELFTFNIKDFKFIKHLNLFKY